MVKEESKMQTPPPYRDARPTYQLNEQERSWTAPKFMVLLAATLVVAIGIIVAAANASY